ncbi:MAG TPA: tetratricopeptide repeat protein [Pirellulaceae bacterium]|nr:tetratricopeptide repeat protein [Pirellulaceae bacterium]
MRRILAACAAVMAALCASVTQAQDAYTRFDQLRLAAQYAEAEKIAIAQKAHFEQNAPHELPSIATWARNLGNLYLDQGRYDEAEPLFKKALALAEEHAKIWPPEIYDLTRYQVDLADLYLERSRYDLAEPLVLGALKYRQKGQLVDPEVQVQSLLRAAGILRSQGMEDLAREAEKYATNRPGDEKVRREINTAAVAQSLDQHGRLLMETGKYADAEKSFLESLELREDLWGPLQRDVAWSMDQLGQLYLVMGQYSKAEARLKKGVSIREEVLGKDKTDTAAALVNLGAFYARLGRAADADITLLRAIDIYAQRSWLGHPDAAQAQFVLGSLYAQRGRFAEADKLHRRALAVRQKVFAAQHKSLAQSFNAIARLLVQHGRAEEATKLAADSLAIREKIYGDKHIEVAAACQRLAEVEQATGSLERAADYLKRAAEVRRAALGERHPDVAQSLSALGRLRAQQDQRDEARRLLNQALEIQREKLGAHHEDTLTAQLDLAELDLKEGRPEEAKIGLAQAAKAAGSGAISPQTASRLEALQAELSWNEGAQNEALMHLERAIEQAEQQRAFAAGAEQEQGALFAQFAALYHRLVAWRLSLGNTGDAFAAMERARARSLLDQMALQGADPLAGLDPDQRESIGRKHAQAQLRLAGLTRQLHLLSAAPVNSTQQRDQERQRLIETIRTAQDQVLDAYRELRAASRTFQLAGKEGTPVAALPEIQQFVKRRNAAFISFLVADDACYRLVLTPDGEPELGPIEVSADLAAELGIEPMAKLSAEQFWALFRVEGKELSQWLADAKGLEKAQSRLAALWQILVPSAMREGLTSDAYDLLIVAPDGPLARLPLEALVLEPGADPKFLLDVGPPTIYVPSATVLLQLASRAPVKSQKEPLLSVGDPLYQEASAVPTRGAALVSPGTRFAAMAGGLSRLPFTAWETKWVVETFARQGMPGVSLVQQEATERACREKMPGREIVHLACHGLCDEGSGNLFGALALSANPSGAIDPADDGFLTLAEIYGLNLAGNELAILSACQTNAGPLTRGEGVWALSRGFLVAGSRRVVASNWLVDDEAGASLVSYMSAHLAQGRPAGASEYAAALLAAKRAIRQQEKWRAPYYWAGLVLIGPN